MKKKVFPKIYLQIDEHPEITWCQDRIHETDVEYILKSDAVKYVELCPECNGKKWDDVCNCRCLGIGIVPLKEPNEN